MAGLVYVVPYVPPAPPVPKWRGMQVIWTGWDGSQWDLSSGEQGVFLIEGEGIEGFNMPPVSRFTSTSTRVRGSRYRGHRIEEREVFWPLFVYNDVDSDGWLEVDRAFWRTLDPDRAGRLTVIQPSGHSRSIMLRFLEATDSVDRDPFVTGWQIYGITLVADDEPLWAGEAFSRRWGQAEEDQLFIPDEGAPDFFISGSSTIGEARVTNDGDVPAHPRWDLEGGADGGISEASVTVAGKEIGIPFPIAEGSRLVIHTDPRVQVATLDGVDVTGDLDPWGFGEIPAGDNVPLTISITGNGTVQASFTPLYYRAW